MLVLIVLILLQLSAHTQCEHELQPTDESLHARLVHLESDILSRYAKSTYVRAIIWNTMPSPENLKKYFDRFTQLQFDEKWLDRNEFDINHLSDITYERFFYKHYTEQKAIVTVFIKFDFSPSPDSSLVCVAVDYINELFERYLNYSTNQRCSNQPTSYTMYPAIVLLLIACLIIYLFTSYNVRRPPSTASQDSKDQRARPAQSRALAVPETNEQTILAQQEDLEMDYSPTDSKPISEYCKNK